MGRGITLNREAESILPVINRGDGFRLKVTASDGVLMPNEVFLFQRDVLNPLTGTYADHLVAVCSPEDLVTYPITDPMVTDLPPFFRMAVIDVIVGSREIAEDAWSVLQEQVEGLVLALNRKDRLVPAGEVRLGDPLDADVSGSSASLSM